MMRVIEGDLDLGLFSNRRLARIALLGALVAALGLAGCGRKAGLDPPPGASIVDPGAPPPDAAAAVGPDGKPMAPTQAPRRSTPIDFLID
jgi:Prokaryotic lipoprotein-attachment site